MRLEPFLVALDDGPSAAEADGLPAIGLCPSIERRQSREEAIALVDELVALAHPRVRGLSVDGNESVAGRTAERFAPAFERAVCPTSNLTLGLYPQIRDHPIERLRRAGVAVSLNTDDPELLDISLLDEHEACTAAFDWKRADVAALARTSIEASFAPAALRRSMLDELRAFD